MVGVTHDRGTASCQSQCGVLHELDMAFTIEDFHGLVDRTRRQHPAWRGDLRRLLLSDDILDLPRIVGELAQRVGALAAAQQRTEQRIETLAAAQQRTEQRIETLAAAQQHVEEQLARLTEQVTDWRSRSCVRWIALTRRSSTWRGSRATTSSGGTANARRRISPSSCGAFEHCRPTRSRTSPTTPSNAEALTETDRAELLAADLVVRGLRREDGQEAYLVVEVSSLIAAHDVLRATERAAPARDDYRQARHGGGRGRQKRTWTPAIAARDRHAWQVLDGVVVPPDASCLKRHRDAAAAQTSA